MSYQVLRIVLMPLVGAAYIEMGLIAATGVSDLLLLLFILVWLMAPGILLLLLAARG